MGNIASSGSGTSSNGDAITLDYNCSDTFKICVRTTPPNFINLGMTTKCCDEPDVITYVKKDYNFGFSLVNSNITPHFDPNCSDPPNTGCNTCPVYTTWTTTITFDSSPFVSITGSFKQYDITGTTLLFTQNITSFTQLTTPYSHSEHDNSYWIYDFTCTTINGETVHIVSDYYAGEQNCPNDYFSDYSTTITNNISHTYTVVSHCALFTMTLTEGFYTINGTYTGCMIVDCENDLDCQADTYIASKVHSTCFECNKHEDLDAAMEMHMYQEMLNGCTDCCTKCMLYKKMINKLNKCTNC